jgi:hypothetical protein
MFGHHIRGAELMHFVPIFNIGDPEMLSFSDFTSVDAEDLSYKLK